MREADKPSATIRGFRVFPFVSSAELIEMAHAHAPAILVALNAEKVANADARVRRIVDHNIGYPDGMGVVLALRRRGLHTARIAGADLWLELARSRVGQRIYVIGSSRTVIVPAVKRLAEVIPGVIVVGHRDGYLKADDVRELKADLANTSPDLVFVGMGSPQQELLMDALNKAWPTLYMGIGGSLDVFVGQRRRAPAWMQRMGLEWLFRFAENPSRLTRLPAYIRFAWLLARGRF